MSMSAPVSTAPRSDAPGAGACDVAVIGAGPYGLSIAAHLRSRGTDHRVFGPPLSTWRTGMPQGMLLKSDGFASSLSAPLPGSSLGDYCRARGLPYHDTNLPVALETFVDYGLDFQQRFVPDLEPQIVTSVVPAGSGYRVTLDSGEEFGARHVVVAAGITHFAVMPDELAGADEERVTHASAHHDLGGFATKDVTVIGAGSSAVDLAVALADAGARVRIVARAPQVQFGSPPSEAPPNLAERLRRPPSGLGPGWRSRMCCDAPDLFRVVPARWRPEIVRRHLGPSSPWRQKAAIDASVELLLGRTLAAADVGDDGVRLTLTGDGAAATTTVETDHVICATGYRTDLARLTFLDAGLRSRIGTVAGAPTLSHGFESSVPGIHFAGIAAAVTFGPLMRFMYGADFTARRISSRLAQNRV